jgi:hypothetical protein
MNQMLAALLFSVAACGTPDEPAKQTTVQIEKMRALELQVVDHDSEYMRRLYVHVAPDEASKPTNPAALVAGVTAASQDYWPVENKPHLRGHDYFLEATDRGGVTGRTQLDGYLKKLAAADPNFVVPLGHELAYEQTEPGRWRSYYLHSPVVLDGSTVESATAGEQDDRPTVMVDLSSTGQKALADVTSQIVGKKLAILSGNEILSAPIINDAIHGGMFTITMDGDQQKAEVLAKALSRD